MVDLTKAEQINRDFMHVLEAPERWSDFLDQISSAFRAPGVILQPAVARPDFWRNEASEEACEEYVVDRDLCAANPVLQVRDRRLCCEQNKNIVAWGMLQRTAYKFRAYPDPEQDRLFRQTTGCCRLVYNLCLEQRRLERLRSNPRRLTATSQINELKDLKAAAPFLKDVPHHPLQQAIRDLDRAFLNFFEGRAGYPRPRTRFRHESFRYPDPLQIKLDRDGQRIFLPKAGWVGIRIHREIIGDVKNVTVSRQGTWWFVSIAVEQEIDEPVVRIGPSIGIDLGVTNAIATSDGQVFDLPRVGAQEQRQLTAIQRQIARRQKGSHNRQKAILRLRRLQARHARRRADAKHKATSRLVRDHAVIVMEDLKVRNMTATARGTIDEPGSHVAQKAGLNRSLLDVAPGETRRQLEYKMQRAGGQLILVAAPYTSQQCSRCGWTTQENRSSRDRFSCVSCGFAACADVNAAQNILAKGLLCRTGGHPGMACGSSRAGGRKQELEPARVRSPVLQGGE